MTTKLAFNQYAVEGSSPRQHLRYKSATEVYVPNTSATMTGFRFQGQQTEAFGPTFLSPAVNPLLQSVSTASDQGVFNSNEDDMWYAIFACANDGDTSYQLKVMPFFRVKDRVSGNLAVNLGQVDEAGDPATVQNFDMDAGALSGSDALLITESSIATVASRHKWHGKVVGITTNTTSSVTFGEDISELDEGDYFLCSPPGFTHYRYMASFYSDIGADVRNFADDGRQVKSTGITVTVTDETGAAQTIDGDQGLGVTGGRYVQFISHIPPLATSAIVREKGSYSTTSTGFVGSYWDHDGLIGPSVGHPVHISPHDKVSTVTTNPSWDGIELPFSFRQRYRYYTAGALAASKTSATIQIHGWIEP